MGLIDSLLGSPKRRKKGSRRPKAPKTKNPEVYARYVVRLKEWQKRKAAKKAAPEKLRKLKAEAAKIR